MAYQRRTPPIKIKIGIEKFNSLIEYIVSLEKSGIEDISYVAKKLKEKLLRYSIPITNEDGTTDIEIRFFPKEAGEIIILLLNEIDNIIPQNDYYNVLLDVREKIKQSTMK